MTDPQTDSFHAAAPTPVAYAGEIIWECVN